jgi:cation transport ATPase
MPRTRGDSFDNAMVRSLRSVNFALLLVAACSLATGLALNGLGHGAAARIVWTAGALPVTVALGISVVRTLLRRSAGIDVLALLAIAFALVLGEQLTAAVIALMLASGRALEDYAAARAQREMTALLRHAPRVAIRFEGAEWRPVDLDSVRRGDRLLVRHGEVVPVDAALLGAADLDESALTGESVMRKRKPGEIGRASCRERVYVSV